MKVFIYGTLKRGFKNHNWMKKAEYLGECTTKHKYPLLVEGENFPMLLNQKGRGFNVSGELFEIDSLKELDKLECAPDLFHRGDIKVIFNEESIKVKVYFFTPNIQYREENISSRWTKKYDERY